MTQQLSILYDTQSSWREGIVRNIHHCRSMIRCPLNTNYFSLIYKRYEFVFIYLASIVIFQDVVNLRSAVANITDNTLCGIELEVRLLKRNSSSVRRYISVAAFRMYPEKKKDPLGCYRIEFAVEIFLFRRSIEIGLKKADCDQTS